MFGELVTIVIIVGIIIVAILAFFMPAFVFQIRDGIVKIRRMMEELIKLLKAKELRRDPVEGSWEEIHEQ